MHTIRKGEPRDIAAIAVIYDRILDREERGGASTGWIRGVYPTADTARAALEAGELFVMEREGRVVVAGRINHEQCPQYAAVPWTEPETPDEQVLVLHTLVSDPLVAGHGCGTEFVAFYEQYAREHGCTWLRIDTNARNVSGAEKFIDFLCRGDIAAMNYEYVGYAIPNTAAIDIIGADEYNASPVNNPPQEALDHCEVFKYLGDDTKLYDQVWTEIISEF